MNEILARKFRFVVSPTRFYPSHLEVEMRKAYLSWRSVWREAFSEEMNVKDELYADNYTRQSHVAVLFYDDEPFALTTLNIMDLDKVIYQDDSYFRIWPSSVIDQLRSHSRSILTCCNVTLNFPFRKSALGISGKDLMLSMLVQYLKHSVFDSIVAAVRLEKGMEKASYRTGAYALHRNVPYTVPGQMVDLVCWRRDLDLALLNPEITTLAEYIWKKSSLVVERQFLQGEKYAA